MTGDVWLQEVLGKLNGVPGGKECLFTMCEIKSVLSSRQLLLSHQDLLSKIRWNVTFGYNQGLVLGIFFLFFREAEPLHGLPKPLLSRGLSFSQL